MGKVIFKWPQSKLFKKLRLHFGNPGAAGNDPDRLPPLPFQTLEGIESMVRILWNVADPSRPFRLAQS